MSGVIKSGGAPQQIAVRRLSSGPVTRILSREEQETESLRARIAQLEEELSASRANNELLVGRVAMAREEGEAEGRRLGLLAAEARDVERLAILESTACEAQAQLGLALTSLERLAALLASECLEIMFGDGHRKSGFVMELLARQLNLLEKAAVVEVRVSASDFAPESGRRDLSSLMAGENIHVSIRDDLPAGACVLRLSLGTMEIGLDQQWGTLKQVLSDLSGAEDVS